MSDSEYKAHPLRIQRGRAVGSKSGHAVYVGRPTKWGNPYRDSECAKPGMAVDCFRILVESEEENIKMVQDELRGKVLSCWCPLDVKCHADVLAEIANRELQ
jgi:hypothetical protein